MTKTYDIDWEKEEKYKSLAKDIKRVLRYLWHDEEKNYEENDTEGKRAHIFHVLKRLASGIGIDPDRNQLY